MEMAFIVVSEYKNATPLVTFYNYETNARDAFMRRKNNKCFRCTLYNVKVDSLGFDQAVELDTFINENESV